MAGQKQKFDLVGAVGSVPGVLTIAGIVIVGLVLAVGERPNKLRVSMAELSCSGILMILAVLALLPIIIALAREHRNAGAIVVCAIIGIIFWPCWIVAMIWCFTDNTKKSQ